MLDVKVTTQNRYFLLNRSPDLPIERENCLRSELLRHSLRPKSKCIRWQWRNFFIPNHARCPSCHDVGQENVNILQHLQSDRRSGASTKLFLNQPIQFHLNNVTNRHQLTAHAQYDVMPYDMEIVSWRRLLWLHFTIWHCMCLGNSLTLILKNANESIM